MTTQMPSPDARSAYLKKLVSSARSIVTYHVGIPVGCLQITKILGWIAYSGPLDFPVFERYLQAVRDFPISNDRLQWDRASLSRLDTELEAINQRFRDEIFSACYQIIDQYGSPGQPSRVR